MALTDNRAQDLAAYLEGSATDSQRRALDRWLEGNAEDLEIVAAALQLSVSAPLTPKKTTGASAVPVNQVHRVILSLAAVKLIRAQPAVRQLNWMTVKHRERDEASDEIDALEVAKDGLRIRFVPRPGGWRCDIDAPDHRVEGLALRNDGEAETVFMFGMASGFQTQILTAGIYGLVINDEPPEWLDIQLEDPA